MSPHNLNKFMADRVTICRMSESQDKFGGAQETEDKVGINVPARIYSRQGQQMVRVEGKTFLPTKRMVVAQDVDLKVNDRVQTATDSYKVVKIDAWRDESRLTHKTAMLMQEDL